MTEAHVLELLVEMRADSVEWLGHFIALNIAMFAGAYLFINQAPLTIRIMAFTLYSLAFYLFLALIVLHNQTEAALRADLAAVATSAAARIWTTQNDGGWTHSVDVALLAAIALVWSGAFFITFVWRKPGFGTETASA